MQPSAASARCRRGTSLLSEVSRPKRRKPSAERAPQQKTSDENRSQELALSEGKREHPRTGAAGEVFVANDAAKKSLGTVSFIMEPRVQACWVRALLWEPTGYRVCGVKCTDSRSVGRRCTGFPCTEGTADTQRVTISSSRGRWLLRRRGANDVTLHFAC